MKSIVKKVILVGSLIGAVNPAPIAAGWLSSFTEFKSAASSATTSFLQSVEKKKAAMTAFSAAVVGFCGWNMLRNRYNKNLKPNEPAAQKQKNEVPTQAAAGPVIVPAPTPAIVAPVVVQAQEKMVVSAPPQDIPSSLQPHVVAPSAAIVLDDGGSVSSREVISAAIPVRKKQPKKKKKSVNIEDRWIRCGNIDCGEIVNGAQPISASEDADDGQEPFEHACVGGDMGIEGHFCYRYYCAEIPESEVRTTLLYIGDPGEENIFERHNTCAAQILTGVARKIAQVKRCSVDIVYFHSIRDADVSVYERRLQFLLSRSGPQQLDLSGLYIIACGKGSEEAEFIKSRFEQEDNDERHVDNIKCMRPERWKQEEESQEALDALRRQDMERLKDVELAKRKAFLEGLPRKKNSKTVSFAPYAGCCSDESFPLNAVDGAPGAFSKTYKGQRPTKWTARKELIFFEEDGSGQESDRVME